MNCIREGRETGRVGRGRLGDDSWHGARDIGDGGSGGDCGRVEKLLRSGSGM